MDWRSQRKRLILWGLLISGIGIPLLIVAGWYFIESLRTGTQQSRAAAPHGWELIIENDRFIALRKGRLWIPIREFERVEVIDGHLFLHNSLVTLRHEFTGTLSSSGPVNVDGFLQSQTTTLSQKPGLVMESEPTSRSLPMNHVLASIDWAFDEKGEQWHSRAYYLFSGSSVTPVIAISPQPITEIEQKNLILERLQIE